MQTISLYDYLTINICHAVENKITLSGTSKEIPYDEKNLVYKATDLYLKKSGIKDLSVDVYIEKNIPIAAGLAGGSTDAAGVLYGLNSLLKIFNKEEIEDLCASLGSDLNVCLNGGCVLATSRGEVTQKLPNIQSEVTLIKPKKLGISAGEAYKKYALKTFKPQNNITERMVKAIKNGDKIEPYLYNDLEYAVFEDYEELQKIKTIYPNAVMSGSGSTYFITENLLKSELDDDYLFINNLKFIPDGVAVMGII